jgi:hypothetical protein
MQSGSKRCAPPGVVVGFGALADGVEASGEDVPLDLAIPRLGDILLEPLREASKLLLGKLSNGCFEIVNAHGRKIRNIGGAAIANCGMHEPTPNENKIMQRWL